MKTIGLTGGIGSGKSTVAQILRTLGIPVYDSDTKAKKLLGVNPDLKQALINEFGTKIYLPSGKIDKKTFAQIIFNDKQRLEKANSIIRPYVREDFDKWVKKQTADCVMQESALLFESGAYKNHQFNIVVSAPQELRINRVMKRDKVQRAEVQKRIQNQMPQEKKNEAADFLIINDGNSLLLPQIKKILQQIINT